MSESTQSQDKSIIGNRIYPGKNSAWLVSVAFCVPFVLAALEKEPVPRSFLIIFGFPGLIFLVIYLLGLWAL